MRNEIEYQSEHKLNLEMERYDALSEEMEMVKQRLSERVAASEVTQFQLRNWISKWLI